MNKKNIPSAREFAMASASLRNHSRGLSEIRENILNYFKDEQFLHEFFIWDCSDKSFVVYVFYHLNKQIQEAENNGLSTRIEEQVYEELDNAGRGKRESIRIKFEFDSHENVELNYGGDYYSRLR